MAHLEQLWPGIRHSRRHQLSAWSPRPGSLKPRGLDTNTGCWMGLREEPELRRRRNTRRRIHQRLRHNQTEHDLQWSDYRRIRRRNGAPLLGNPSQDLYALRSNSRHYDLRYLPQIFLHLNEGAAMPCRLEWRNQCHGRTQIVFTPIFSRPHVDS